MINNQYVDAYTYNAYKEKMGERVTRRLSQGIKEKEVTEDQATEIAAYILDNIDKTSNSLEVLNFLTELAQKWPLFSQLLTIEHGQIIEKKEDDAVAKMTG